jgi:hypothetical protein
VPHLLASPARRHFAAATTSGSPADRLRDPARRFGRTAGRNSLATKVDATTAVDACALDEHLGGAAEESLRSETASFRTARSPVHRVAAMGSAARSVCAAVKQGVPIEKEVCQWTPAFLDGEERGWLVARGLLGAEEEGCRWTRRPLAVEEAGWRVAVGALGVEDLGWTWASAHLGIEKGHCHLASVLLAAAALGATLNGSSTVPGEIAPRRKGGHGGPPLHQSSAAAEGAKPPPKILIRCPAREPWTFVRGALDAEHTRRCAQGLYRLQFTRQLSRPGGWGSVPPFCIPGRTARGTREYDAEAGPALRSPGLNPL